MSLPCKHHFFMRLRHFHDDAAFDDHMEHYYSE